MSYRFDVRDQKFDFIKELGDFKVLILTSQQN